MSLFNWFQKNVKLDEVQQPVQTGPVQLAAAQPEPLDPRKHQRHVRREQLYVAIRAAMTRSGVLSAGYKFKALSLDQTGDEFMIMIDLAPGLEARLEKLKDMETIVINIARERFGIVVQTVYWRLTGTAVLAVPGLAAAREAVPAAADFREPFLPSAPSAARHGIAEDDLAAFNHTVLAASSKSQTGAPEKTVNLVGKSMGYRSLANDFAETEMMGEGKNQAPSALGNTQYGDLK